MKNIDISVLSQDLFKLIEMEDLEATEQEKFLNDFLNTVSRHFIQEKVTGQMTLKEKEALAEKYGNVDKNTIYEMLTELSNRIENIEDLYLESMAEIKAKVVKDFYTDKVRILEDLLSKETDANVSANLKQKLELCSKKLAFALEGRYDQIVNLEQ